MVKKSRLLFGLIVFLPLLMTILTTCEPIHRLPCGRLIDSRATDLSLVPESWIAHAKATLCIAYGHTSHGSQLIDGMNGLDLFMGDTGLYDWNGDGSGAALQLRDTPFSGASDLGNPDYTAWEQATRNYLNDTNNSDVNVVIWSWCGEVTDATESDINTYLSLMDGLETDFPNVGFVYMTGHLDGATSESDLDAEANLLARNEQIRAYCIAHDKWLYDFADLDSHDPAGINYADLHCTDSGTWDANGNGLADEGGDPGVPDAIPNPDQNWMIEWQESHTEGIDWYECNAAHSFPVNANRKAFAAWWLWARLGGWQP